MGLEPRNIQGSFEIEIEIKARKSYNRGCRQS